MPQGTSFGNAFQRDPLARLLPALAGQLRVLRELGAEVGWMLDQAFTSGDAVDDTPLGLAYWKFWLWTLGAREVFRALDQASANLSERANARVDEISFELDLLRAHTTYTRAHDARDLCFAVRDRPTCARQLLGAVERFAMTLGADDVLVNP